jgi:hypothetical protein
VAVAVVAVFLCIEDLLDYRDYLTHKHLYIHRPSRDHIYLVQMPLGRVPAVLGLPVLGLSVLLDLLEVFDPELVGDTLDLEMAGDSVLDLDMVDYLPD